jgi:hypothetical protein
MSENLNNETLTGMAGAQAMVASFTDAVVKVAATCDTFDEACALVLNEVASTDAERFARLLRSLELVRQAA